jgi:cell division protein FtsB
MPRRSRELWYALGAMVVITLAYLAVVARLEAIPAASDLFGHTLGIVGFLLMLMTETLYSVRKRSRSARWGRMASWLRFHIFTGLVGPYMVLLHTSWKFNGLAGVVTALMIVVVFSGIIGRYIYTTVPRTADGIEIERGDLEQQIQAIEAELEKWRTARPEAARAVAHSMEDLAGATRSDSGPLLVLGRAFQEWGYRLRWWLDAWRMDASIRAQARELDKLVRRQRALRRQVSSLAVARRMLATWHSVHIPVGVVLFTAAFVHIGAAIYYATLLT